MMRILIISLITFVACISLQGQNKIDLYLEASPNYSFRTFKNNSEIRFSDDYSKFGYTVTINISYQLSNDFYMISGINFNNKGYKTNIIYFDNLEGMIRFASLNLNFLEIPLYIKYQSSFNKFHISPVIGMSYGRLIGIVKKFDDKRISASQKEIKDSGFNNIVLNLHGGLEFSYQLINNLKVKIEPKFDYSITDVKKGENKMIKENLYIIGFNIGIIITI